MIADDPMCQQIFHIPQIRQRNVLLIDISCGMPWDPNLPYNDLPGLPPAADIESKAILKAVTRARVEVARLDQATSLLADPGVLLHNIALLEAQASSEIENIVTTTDELFRRSQLFADSGDPAIKETLRYRSALYLGLDGVRARGLTVGTAIDVCTAAKGHQMQIRAVPGTRIANPATQRIIYSPPEGVDLIRDRLSDWERYVNLRTDVDPLVIMAVAHYQFEAIHPFTDGNGRTGRILNILMLVNAGLLRQPVLYLSRPIIETKADYYRLLQSVTAEGAWEDWILYMIDAVRQAAAATTDRITAVARARSDFLAQYREATPGMVNADFHEVLFSQPYCRIQQVVAHCGVTRQTATAWLSALVDAGALGRIKVGRERLFLNHAFWRALTEPTEVLRAAGDTHNETPE